ncbi:hypothetical protein [Spirillospora sp. NPDC029432]|uniref:hypothetical protein n=1 Tax=Spirillospora sp. NPDC029432 TaxID=3154599 RepID=UPI0034552992
MTRSPEELRELLADAEEMPEGEAKVGAVQDVLRWAEAAALLDIEIEARLVLVDALIALAQDTEDVNAVITAFTRNVALYGRHPDLFDDYLLDGLWRQFAAQGIVLSLMVEYPLRLVNGVFDDMERRCRPDRDDLHTVHSLRLLLADLSGDREAGERSLAELRHREAADYACPACLATFQVRFLANRGRDAEAIELARPILSGELPCDTGIQPAETLHVLQSCHLRVGDLDEARDAHRLAYRGLDHDSESDVAQHLVFCVLSGNTERALSIVKRDLVLFEGTPTTMYELELAAAAAMVFGALADEGRGGEVLFWPANPDFPEDEDEEWTFAELRDDFARDAAELAARYDARHGNTHVGDRVRATLETRAIVPELPLTPLAARRKELAEAAAVQPAPAPAEGESEAETATQMAAEEDALDEALGHARRGDELLNSGRAGDAIGAFIEATARFTALGQTRLATHARVDLATAYLTVGRALDAAECAEEALPDISPEDDAEYTGMQARWVLACAYPDLDQPGDALDRLAEMAARTADPAILGRLDRQAGGVLSAEDRDEEAAERYTAAAHHYAAAGNAFEEAVCLRQAALAHCWAGDVDTALATAERAGRVAERFPDGDAERGAWESAVLRYDTARILAAHDRLDEASAEAARAAEAFRETGDRAFVTRCELLAGRLRYGLADHGGAAAALRRALAESADPDGDEENAAERKRAAELLAEVVAERSA